MNPIFRLFTILLLAFNLLSCSSNTKSAAVYYSESDSSSDDYADDDDCIIVPFTEKDGVKYIPVKVNGVSFEMIFDTGCSIGTTLSMKEASYLYHQGELSDDDFIGKSQSVVADGRIVNDAVVNLREVVIGDKIRVNNVRATISNNTTAPLLLGNDILDATATITIDNEAKVLKFKLKKTDEL